MGEKFRAVFLQYRLLKRTLTFITFAPSFTTLAALALAAFFAGHGVHVVAGKGDRARRAGWADQSLKNASQKLQKEQLTDLEFSPHQQIRAR
jgi:hypothetical protein